MSTAETPRRRQARHDATDERFKVTNAAHILSLLDDAIGSPHSAVPENDMLFQQYGLAVEYIADRLLEHAEALGAALDKLEG